MSSVSVADCTQKWLAVILISDFSVWLHASMTCFLSCRVLVSGSQVLGLWRSGEPDPVDSMYSDLNNRKSMILQVGFVELDIVLYMLHSFTPPLIKHLQHLY